MSDDYCKAYHSGDGGHLLDGCGRCYSAKSCAGVVIFLGWMIIIGLVVVTVFLCVFASCSTSWCCSGRRNSYAYRVPRTTSRWTNSRARKLLSSGASVVHGAQLRGDVLLDSVLVHPATRRLRRLRTSGTTPAPLQQARFPKELFDLILSMCDDNRTLLSCGLVCYGWLPASRSIFPLPITTRRRALALCRLLRSPYETFSPNVHSLILDNRYDSGGFRNHQRALHILLRKHTIITHVEIRRNISSVVLVLPRYFPNITHLSLESYPTAESLGHTFGLNRSEATRDLAAILPGVHRFPNLRSLVIEIPTQFLGTVAQVPAKDDLLPVVHLRVAGRWTDGLLFFFQPRARHLTSLEVDLSSFSVSDYSVMQTLIRANAGTLKRLWIGGWGSAATTAPLTLHSLKNLEEISFIIHVGPSTSEVYLEGTLSALLCFETADPMHLPQSVSFQTFGLGHFVGHDTKSGFKKHIERVLGRMDYRIKKDGENSVAYILA